MGLVIIYPCSWGFLLSLTAFPKHPENARKVLREEKSVMYVSSMIWRAQHFHLSKKINFHLSARISSYRYTMGGYVSVSPHIRDE